MAAFRARTVKKPVLKKAHWKARHTKAGCTIKRSRQSAFGAKERNGCGYLAEKLANGADKEKIAPAP